MTVPHVIRTEAYLGPAFGWVNVPARKRSATHGGAFVITRAETPEGEEPDPSKAALFIDNRTGDWSDRNPRSPYFGILGQNTPLRVAILLAQDDFDRTASSTWGTAPTGQGWSAYLAPLSAYAVTPGLAAQSHSTDGELRAVWLDVWAQDAEQVSDIEVPSAVTGAAVVAGHVHRYQVDGSHYWLRLEFNAGGSTVTVKLSREAGGLTELAEIVDVPGLTYTAGQPLRLRTSVVGRRLSLMAWDPSDPGAEPADWMLTWVDDSADAILAPGSPGLMSWLVGGNSNANPFAVGFANYQLLDRRAWMEVPSWPPRWDLSGADRWVPIEAAGILRRLNQGTRPVLSALDRFLPGTGVVQFWPLNDGANATIARSGLRDGQPLTVRSGVMEFVPGEGPPGAGGAAHPDPTAANALTGRVTGVSDQAWHVSIWSKGIVTEEAREGALDAFYVAWEIETSGGWTLRSAFQYAIDEAAGVAIFPDATTNTATDNLFLDDPAPHLNPGITGKWQQMTFAIQQSGANCNVYLLIDEVEVASAVWSNITIGAPIGVKAISEFGAGQGTSLRMADIYLSTLTFHNGVSLIAQHQAGLGFPGETAVDRLERACAEEGDGVPISIVRGPRSPAMGPQLPGTFLDIVKDSVDVDRGLIGEVRERIALSYRAGSSLLNQDWLELEYGHISEPFEPSPDDKTPRNDITIRRENGSAARAVLETGRMSVLPPEQGGIGRYEVEYPVNTAGDLPDLPNQAWWRLHVDTWDEARWPQVTIDLLSLKWRQDPDLVAEAVAVAEGDLISIGDLPTWVPPGPLLLMSRGSVEEFDSYFRTITWNKAPGGPYDVAVADGPQRVPARGSTVLDALSDVGTELLVGSTVDNGPWLVGTTVEYPGVFPLAVRVGGEHVEVEEIAPSVVDGMTRTVVAGWGTPDASYLGVPYGLVGGSASDYSVVGGSTARMAVASTNVLYTAHLDIAAADAEIEGRVTIPVVPTGAPITPRLGGRFTDASNLIEAQVTLATSGTATLQLFRRVAGTGSSVPGTGPVSVGSHAAGNAWTIRMAYDGNRVYARAWNASTGSDPGHWQAYGEDDTVPRGTEIAALIRRETGNTNVINADWDNIRVLSPQVMTISTRGTNGIQRAWPAGRTEVQVRDRAIAAW